MADPGKRKPKKTRDTLEENQAKRFKETARLLGVDQTGVGFERVFNAIAPPKRASKPARKTKTPAK